MNKWTLINWTFFLLVSLSPFLLLYLQKVPGDLPVDITFMSGLITGSGIFFALITSFIATQRNALPRELVPMLFMNWALLFLAGSKIFESAIGTTPHSMALAWVTASFNANSYTAGVLLVLRIFVKPRKT
jgi:hypothetical protein